jgi:hypothetical protein
MRMPARLRPERLVDDLTDSHKTASAIWAAAEAFVDSAWRPRAKLANCRIESGFNGRIGHDIARAYDHSGTRFAPFALYAARESFNTALTAALQCINAV